MIAEEKACIKCNELWPNDAEFFQSNRGVAGLLCVCRACYQEHYRSPSQRSKKAQTAPIEITHTAALQGFFASLVTASQQQRKRA